MPKGRARQIFLEWDAHRLEGPSRSSCCGKTGCCTCCIAGASAEEEALLVVPALRLTTRSSQAACTALAALEDACGLAVPMLLRQLLRAFEQQADAGLGGVRMTDEPPQLALQAAGGIVACLLVAAVAKRTNAAICRPALLSTIR